MTNSMRAVLVAGMLSLSGIASAGPLEDGVAAYERNDYATTLKLLPPLAQNGDATAQFTLGMMYQQGQGVAPDQKAAYKWFHLAAEQGDAGAEWIVGAMLANGQGIEKNVTEAARWYRLAAVQGDVEAQHFLGVAYANGTGVDRDDALAFMWLKSAASQGNAEAARKLDILAAGMTPKSIENGEILAFACEEAKFKNCD